MSHFDEEGFALRLRQELDAGAEQLRPQITERLFQARRAALSRHSDKRNAFPFVGSAVLVAALPKLKLAMMTIGLCAGLAGTYFWHLHEEAASLGEIDSALLADELPPNAYIDQGFRLWLERASPNSAPE
jgi:hypothetical protein